jgi:hypothetical protein
MWSWIDNVWDTIETLEGSERHMKIVYKWLLRCRPPQSENEYIEFLIKKIWNDAYIFRAFKDLLSREDGQHPAIIAKWRPVESGRLLYLGETTKPTAEELKERKAIAWLMARGIAEPVSTTDPHDNEQWYFLSEFGWKVKNKYQAMYQAIDG